MKSTTTLLTAVGAAMILACGAAVAAGDGVGDMNAAAALEGSTAAADGPFQVGASVSALTASTWRR